MTGDKVENIVLTCRHQSISFCTFAHTSRSIAIPGNTYGRTYSTRSTHTYRIHNGQSYSIIGITTYPSIHPSIGVSSAAHSFQFIANSSAPKIESNIYLLVHSLLLIGFLRLIYLFELCILCIVLCFTVFRDDEAFRSALRCAAL